MAQIASTDVVYAYIEGTAKADPSSPSTERVFTIQFGDGSLTYTNTGIPLDKAKLGCPANLMSMIMLDTGNTVGYVPKWNATTNRIRLYQDANVTAAAAAALVEVLTSAAVTSTTLRVLVQGY
jgi:hypothetical protein